MKKLNIVKMPGQYCLLSKESYKLITPRTPAEWEYRDFGYFANVAWGSEFNIKIADNLIVNGIKALNFEINEYVKENVQYANTMTPGLQRLKDLMDKVEPVTLNCTLSSHNSIFAVHKIEGYSTSEFRGLINDFFISGQTIYNNINFSDNQYKISQAELWKHEGKCPQCGQEGKFFRTALICSLHGIYAGF